MKTLTTLALEEIEPHSDQAESLRLVLGEIDRLNQTTQQLLGYVRPQHSSGICNLSEVIDASVQIAGHLARQRQIELRCPETQEALRINAPRDALQSVLLNLVLNAIEACPHGGTVTIRYERQSNRAMLSVQDTGCGISPEMRERLFQPLATSKPEGTGLGLYSVALTVRDLGGEVDVDSLSGHGTLFRVTLPCLT